MDMGRRAFLGGAGALGVMGLAACTGSAGSGSDGSDSTGADGGSDSTLSLAFDDQTWNYDGDHDVYYRLGSTYLVTPAAPDHELLAVFVPGAYLSATQNDDGTYAATVNSSGTVGDYTAATAPIVFPVDTPGFAAQAPLTEYSYDTVAAYLEAGFVYVHAGLRGVDTNTDSYTGNAPWGVTDLKSAVRYVRYNAGVIPGNTDSIFVFGHSGGGAQSAVMGASGDSDLYTAYLESLGAAMQDADGAALSDAVAGAMCWCPITSLDYANAAYEWNMGQFYGSGTRESGTWTEAYSKDLAAAFAAYQNSLSLTDDSGTELKLTESSSGVYLSGTYYDHVVALLSESLNNFLADTTFPYTATQTSTAGMDTEDTETSGASTTYASVQDYVDALNADTSWVTYDADSNTATVTGLKGFVRSQKPATKDVGAFDGVDRGQLENTLMGLGEDSLHFAGVCRDVIDAGVRDYADLSGWSDDFGVNWYTSDFAETDSVGEDVTVRAAMYNPMYYLNDRYEGYGSSTVAPHWRIRSGVMQSDTAVTTEVNLALALTAAGVAGVDFATVWGQGHVLAERTGDATGNFVTWVKESVAG